MHHQSLFAILLLVALLCEGIVPNRVMAAEMQYPLAIASDTTGTVYIADRTLPGVWQVKDGSREIYFEGSKKFRTPLNAVRCLTIDAAGNLLAGDSATREVYRFDANRKPIPLTKGGVGIPMALALNKSQDLFIADLETRRIYKQPAGGGDLSEFAVVPAPRGMAIDSDDRLWVVVHGKDQLLRFTPDGKSEVIITGRPFDFPHHIVLDKEQNAYIADGYGKGIWKVGPDKKPVKLTTGDPLSNPVGLCFLREKLLVVDPRSKDFVYSIEADGKPLAFPMAGK